MSNGEGYPDHTAEVAIFNVCKEQSNKRKERRHGDKRRTRKAEKGQKA